MTLRKIFFKWLISKWSVNSHSRKQCLSFHGITFHCSSKKWHPVITAIARKITKKKMLILHSKSRKIRENCHSLFTFYSRKFWSLPINKNGFGNYICLISRVWKTKNSLIEKKIVKSTILLTCLVKPLLSRNFSEKMWERISAISTHCSFDVILEL